MMVVDVATLDPKLVEACGERPTIFCEAAWNVSHNRLFARAADWVITRPLLAILILLVAALLNRWLRRLVTGLIARVAARDRIAAAALGRIGVGAPSSLSTSDPRTARRSETLATVARAVVSGLVWGIGVLMALGLFHIDLGPLLAGAGIAGIAVGLGAQSLVRDCIAGFFIILEDQFGVGDDVDLGPAVGSVESLTLRATTVRGADGTLWSVPNGAIARVGNQSKLWSNALLDVTIWHETDIAAAIEVMGRVAEEVCARPAVAPLVLEPPRVLGVERFTTDGVTLRMLVRTSPGAQSRVAREMRAALQVTFQSEGILLHRPAAPDAGPRITEPEPAVAPPTPPPSPGLPI